MGTFFGVPKNKDYSILGSILGSPYFGKLPYIHIYIYVRIYRWVYLYIYIHMYEYVYKHTYDYVCMFLITYAGTLLNIREEDCNCCGDPPLSCPSCTSNRFESQEKAVGNLLLQEHQKAQDVVFWALQP